MFANVWHFAKWRNTIGYAILALQSWTLITHEISNTQYLTKITQTKIKNQSTASKNTFKRNHIGLNTRFFLKNPNKWGRVYRESKETLCFFPPILGNEGRQ